MFALGSVVSWSLCCWVKSERAYIWPVTIFQSNQLYLYLCLQLFDLYRISVLESVEKSSLVQGILSTVCRHYLFLEL